MRAALEDVIPLLILMDRKQLIAQGMRDAADTVHAIDIVGTLLARAQELEQK
jgi:hypothetical protein